ncbi:MAG: TolC family protein, partial [Bacteroidales bacterium]|nr:TolC family protein [Bacteroidales bacterium]
FCILCAPACCQTTASDEGYAPSATAGGKRHYAPKYAYRVEVCTPQNDTTADSLHLNLDEAVEYALAHNKNLLQTKNEVLKAVYSKREAIANYIPQAKATVDFNTYFNKKMDMGSAFGAPMEIKMPNTSSLNAQASQVVFNGNAMVGIMLGKIGQAMAELNEENAELTLINTVSMNYHLVLLTKANYDILTRNVNDLKDLFKKTQAMVQAGAMEQTDADQLQVQVNLLENMLKNTERNIELVINTLKIELGMNVTDELVLTESLDDLIASQNDLLLLSLPYEMEADPTYRLVEKNEEMAEKQKLMAVMNFVPTIAGFYQYTYQILKPEFNMQPNHVAGVSATIPIFSGLANTNKHRQARIDLYNAQLQKDLVKDQLLTQEKQMRFNLSTALEQYNTQKINIEVASRVFKSIQLKYE